LETVNDYKTIVKRKKKCYECTNPGRNRKKIVNDLTGKVKIINYKCLKCGNIHNIKTKKCVICDNKAILKLIDIGEIK
jgi:uncharacterized OB-fold protein